MNQVGGVRRRSRTVVTLVIRPSKSYAHAVLHELDLLPLHEFALGFVGATLGVAGFLAMLWSSSSGMGPPSGASASRVRAWSRRLDHGEGAASGSGLRPGPRGRRR